VSAPVPTSFRAAACRANPVPTSRCSPTPENLLRYGLTGRLELRFQSSNAVTQHTHSAPSALDSQDVALSAKILLSPPNRPWPRSAILALSMPTGSDNQTSGSYDPAAQLIWEQILPRGFSLLEIPALTLTTFDGGRRPAWAASAWLGRSLSPALAAFAEFAPSRSAQGHFAYVVDSGFTLATTPLRQIDLRIGFQRDDAGAHTLLSLGYSFRMDRFLVRLAFPQYR
jgi:hypothetical protein